MLSLNQSKFIHSLGVKKYRQQHRKFVVEGEKMTDELLGQSQIAISAIYGTEAWAESRAALLAPFRELFQPVSEAELGKISGLTTPNRVLAIAAMPEILPEPAIARQSLCFYLDGIQDPGNMGSILRVADWFGFPAVFCSADTVDLYNPKVVQATMGAIFRVKSREISLAEMLQACPDLPVAGAVLEGANLFQAGVPRNGLLVIGSEGRGISAAVENLLTHRITIPRHPQGKAESLNAAIAAGILAAFAASRP